MPEERLAAPSWLRVVAWASLPGTVVFSLRLAYEQTILTWKQGEQMIGFSLAHVFPGLLILFILSVLAAHIYLVAFVIVFALRSRQQRQIAISAWLITFAFVISLTALYLPYGFWKVLTVEVAGPGPHGTQLLVYAAGSDQMALVKTLLAHGIPVDASNDTAFGSSTALNAACASRRSEMVRFLLQRGAVLSRAPDCQGTVF